MTCIFVDIGIIVFGSGINGPADGICPGANIHVFVLTDCKNNRFQKKFIRQNTKIWIFALPIMYPSGGATDLGSSFLYLQLLCDFTVKVYPWIQNARKKQFVSLLFQCSINKTKDENLIEGAHGICDELPDGNAAEPYPLDNVYENTKTPTVIPTTSPTTAIPTTSPTTAIPSTSPASRATCQAKELNTRLTGMIFFAMSIFSVCMW